MSLALPSTAANTTVLPVHPSSSPPPSHISPSPFFPRLPLSHTFLSSSGGSATTRLLRTSPPTGFPGVDALTYRGSHPVSRLDVEDATLPHGISASLFGYSASDEYDYGYNLQAIVVIGVNRRTYSSRHLPTSHLCFPPLLPFPHLPCLPNHSCDLVELYPPPLCIHDDT